MLCFHEPFCTLRDTGAVVVSDAGGNARSFTVMRELVDFFTDLSAEYRVFIKETTEYAYDELFHTPLFDAATKIALLVRSPAEAVPSHLKMIPDLAVETLGYENLWRIGYYLRSKGMSFHLIDSTRLVCAPLAVATEYCRFVGIEFLAESLRWERGHRVEWSRTTRWHQDVADSVGLGCTAKVAEELDPLLSGRCDVLCSAVQPFYDRILELGAMQPGTTEWG